MRTTIFPMTGMHFKPAFWGNERDFKDVLDSLENVWTGSATQNLSELKETDQAFLMSMDMPGVNKANLEISVEGDLVHIKGKRKNSFADSEEEFQNITRTVHIPKNVDRDGIQAHCEDGVLYLALPKTEKAKARKIEVSENSKNTWTNLLEMGKKFKK